MRWVAVALRTSLDRSMAALRGNRLTPSMGPTWIPTSVVIDPARPNTVRVGTRNHGIQQLTFQLTDLAIELAVTPGAIWTGDVASYSFTSATSGRARARRHDGDAAALPKHGV